MSFQTIQLNLHPHLRDVLGEKVQLAAKSFLKLDTGEVKTSKVFSIGYPTDAGNLSEFAQQCLADHLLNTCHINRLQAPGGFGSCIAVAKMPGVTDDEGTSAQKALSDFLNLNLDTDTQHIFSQEIYYIQNQLPEKDLQRLAEELLGNKLIHHFTFEASGKPDGLELFVPQVQINADAHTETVDLEGLDGNELLQLSKSKLLALNLAEMQAIRQYYRQAETQRTRAAAGLPASPTDCELEVLAQTWSEHCKHKEFNATIHYHNRQTGSKQTIRSLFKTFIKGATDKVAESLKANGNHWIIKVFNDNAGVVRINERTLFVWKVETHNSPSALDPYGGAITGILGNNRDPLGTGIGGAKLLFNTNVLCFGSPRYAGPLLTGQLHPQRIFAGVRHGIEDGGNKSGVPTVNGAIVFDDRFRGKPLVYCGTGAIMPPQYNGRNSWEKRIDAGDLILVIGGRVGKDGIHGATFSSVEIDEHSPQSAVQIGSPITQKLASDFLELACRKGLVKCSTDNGAGGLSSSIGELATISGGALVHLERVPLKYAGLKLWEIFVSESQERMTLVAEADKLPQLQSLAQKMEVELTHIGEFTDTGALEVHYNGRPVCLLDMHFLHEGVPQKTMEAEWEAPQLSEPKLPAEMDYSKTLLQLMGSLNICSREGVIRQYDHEVKGKTVLKPLMGRYGKAPQDAAVMRIDFGGFEGMAVSNGILPRYGDIDPYQMSAGAFDEAVRQIIAVGGSLPNQSPDDGICWSVNDNFCVPDSDYHPETNPDGKLKLAKLVQMCMALYDMATHFDIPLTSGKDSMKNDYKGDGVKISVPPTILYSMAAKIPDVRKTVTSDFKAPGDLIYQLGETYDELGASEFYALHGKLGANVPRVRPEAAKRLYQKMAQANRKNLIESCHDLSDGGLAVALTECCFGDLSGVEVDLAPLQANTSLHPTALLFSESHSRFVASVSPQNQAAFEHLMGKDATLIGEVRNGGIFSVKLGQRPLIELPVAELLDSWSSGLEV